VLGRIEPSGAKIVGWNEKYIDPSAIEAIHRSHRFAWVYTVNDPARALELTRWGIDGITSDDPARIIAALAGPQ
jgi:glycerophosphoryl diester phosphodiesterase